QDPFFEEILLAFHNVMSAGMQTNFLVNTFPVLLHVRNWFPGTSWKRLGRELGAQKYKAKTELYEWAKPQVARGSHQPSLLGSLLQDHKLLLGLTPRDRDERLKKVGAIMFGGGTDTASSSAANWLSIFDMQSSFQSANSVVSFVAAMVLNPHVQARGQQELDSVLGQCALPSVSDKERLPYIRNLIGEVFRLYPVAPLALPHVFSGRHLQRLRYLKGDNYLGKCLVRAIGRDPRHYEKPELFNPDRYLDPDVPRPPVFGWGRRKCPGVHFAESSVFINAASILATFTFSKKRDDNGREIIPQIEVERNSIMFELKPFDFEFKPRSEEHRQLILGANTEE
ncbi:hypothetical protein RSAG8_05391, partial [Rhizoctonia solani AG-8 WAC10335]